MAKTLEQINAEFTNLMAENGFTKNGESLYGGCEVYSRIWKKEMDVVWQGRKESSLEIKAEEKYGIPSARIFKNGNLESHRYYSSPKRMINALRNIVAHAGFDF